jgi:hypothetical protein
MMRRTLLGLLISLTVVSVADARRVPRRCRFVMVPVCPPVVILPSPVCVPFVFLPQMVDPLPMPMKRADLGTADPAKFLAQLPSIELEVDEIKFVSALDQSSKFQFEFIPVERTTEKTPATNEKVTLGVFNHSKAVIELQFEQQSFKLGSEEFIRLTLPREFRWRELGQGSRQQVVPLVAEGMELVIRDRK